MMFPELRWESNADVSASDTRGGMVRRSESARLSD